MFAIIINDSSEANEYSIYCGMLRSRWMQEIIPFVQVYTIKRSYPIVDALKPHQTLLCSDYLDSSLIKFEVQSEKKMYHEGYLIPMFSV